MKSTSLILLLITTTFVNAQISTREKDASYTQTDAILGSEKIEMIGIFEDNVLKQNLKE